MPNLDNKRKLSFGWRFAIKGALAFAFSLVAEIERQQISERTRNALKRVRNEGKHLGRPYGFKYKKLDTKKEKIRELLAKNISKAEIARLMGCSWVTIHRYIQKIF